MADVHPSIDERALERAISERRGADEECDRLYAEVERLRKALEKIARYFDGCELSRGEERVTQIAQQALYGLR